jgi:hypothetical protein
VSVVGAGSSPTDYTHRFTNDDLCKPIAKDNGVDDKTLQTYLKHADIDGLVARMRELAEEEVEREAGEAADKAARYAHFVEATWIPANEQGVTEDEGYVEEVEEEVEDDEEEEEDDEDTQEASSILEGDVEMEN